MGVGISREAAPARNGFGRQRGASAVGLFDVAVFVGAELLLAGFVGFEAVAADFEAIGVDALRFRRCVAIAVLVFVGGLPRRQTGRLAMEILSGFLMSRHVDVLTDSGGTTMRVCA
jgi:hypothetical protein